MSTKTKVIGLNQFLTKIYNTDTRISTLLSEIGYDASQIKFLRYNCLEELIDSCILSLNQWIISFSDGERSTESSVNDMD